MTKTEFIQRAIIAMAGKVIGTNGVANSDDWQNMVDEAIDLANITEKRGYIFDEL